APFIVKTRKPVDIVVVYPSNTVNAYSTSGGKSLYTTGVDKAGIVSFLRPTSIQDNAVYGLKWFSSLPGYEVGFISDGDLDDYKSISNAKIIAIVGHSEYWTRYARVNFDQFIDRGGHGLVLSGNTMWWQVRYTKNNQLIRYHELAEDPEEDALLKTTNWSEPSLQYSILSSIGADFPRGGYGLEKDNGWNGFKITTSLSPLLEGTGLKKGDIIDLPSGEYDGAPIKTWSADGYPIPNNDELNFNKIEILGYDRGSRFSKETIGTFIVFKRTETSGIILNGASYDWCSASGMGGKNGTILKKITQNAIEKLLNGKPVFSN
ncbi:MAG TPA: N,N-dimethylformamidase beta subunit family domain-containing protein, partial [Cyclobacteriaceae bacterium]|nr:N,N-dimethylformamidase beta subunit family domain-containing protein [Cyclobacteriaceae bacterium]